MDGTQLQRKNQIYICFPLHPKTTCHRKTVFHTEIQIDMQLILESLMEINNRRTKIWELVLGQHRGAASKQPHCNATSLLSSVPQ